MSEQDRNRTPGGEARGRRISLSRRRLDGLGVAFLVCAAGFLAAAAWVEQPMGMGVLMGLFIASLAGAIAAFALTRRPGGREAAPAPARALETD